MIELVPLCTAVVEVASPLSIGDTPAGARSVSELASVMIEGERMRATLAGGGAAADWMLRAGDLGLIDVRMTVRTDDGALIYITYGGRLDLSKPAEGMTVVAAPLFETSDPRYTWLNRIQAIGKGRLTVGAERTARIDYEFFEVR